MLVHWCWFLFFVFCYFGCAAACLPTHPCRTHSSSALPRSSKTCSVLFSSQNPPGGGGRCSGDSWVWVPEHFGRDVRGPTLGWQGVDGRPPPGCEKEACTCCGRTPPMSASRRSWTVRARPFLLPCRCTSRFVFVVFLTFSNLIVILLPTIYVFIFSALFCRCIAARSILKPLLSNRSLFCQGEIIPMV